MNASRNSPAEDPVAVRFEAVAKEYVPDWTGRRIRALAGVSLSIPRGKVTAFVGPNGSGKSTLLKLAAGLTRPTRGRCEVAGRIGYLPEEPALPEFMTAREIVAALAEMDGRDNAVEVDRVLGAALLARHGGRRVLELSKGMRQRLGLAVAMVGAPELLLLDEPTDGLDPLAVEELLGILAAETERGTTIVFTSHFLPAVERLADFVVILEGGRILLSGKRDDVRARGGVEAIYREMVAR